MTNSRPPAGHNNNPYLQPGSSPYGFNAAPHSGNDADQTARWNGQIPQNVNGQAPQGQQWSPNSGQPSNQTWAPGPQSPQSPQGPQSPQSPQGPQGPGGSWSQQPPQGGSSKRNVVALVGLGLAVVGLILSVIPATHVVGWVVLAAALICSIVSLFLKDRSSVTALAALIATAVAAIIAIIVFLIAINPSGGDDSADPAQQPSQPGSQNSQSGTTPSTPAAPAPTSPQQSGSTQAGSQSGQASTSTSSTPGASSSSQTSRDNPLPLGKTIRFGDWDLVINSFDPNATDQLVNEHMTNRPPEDGMTYALINISVTNITDEKTAPAELMYTFIDASGKEFHDHERPLSAADPLWPKEADPGEQVTGNMALAIPRDAEGVLQIKSTWGDAEEYFATR